MNIHSHIETGKIGEEIAAKWLQQHQFEILNRNWKSGRYEIDIIAKRENVLHFIEVKTGRSNLFGFPEQRVGRKKIQHIVSAAKAFLRLTGMRHGAQLDVISISISNGHEYCFFLENICG
jgi:putative endonuclease